MKPLFPVAAAALTKQLFQVVTAALINPGFRVVAVTNRLTRERPGICKEPVKKDTMKEISFEEKGRYKRC
jgi:hypothetical protein